MGGKKMEGKRATRNKTEKERGTRRDKMIQEDTQRTWKIQAIQGEIKVKQEEKKDSKRKTD